MPLTLQDIYNQADYLVVVSNDLQKYYSHKLDGKKCMCVYIPNSVDLNFAFGGRSNDFISRCLITYYDMFHFQQILFQVH